LQSPPFSPIIDEVAEMIRIGYIGPVSGIFGVLSYLVLALVAFGWYPGPYSPIGNWLSDLGSPTLNPEGAAFYNAGVIVTGVFMSLFFAGLSRLRITGNRKQCSMLLVTQSCGVLGSFSLIMSALYPIESPSPHRFWSIFLYVTLGTAFAFSVSALRYHEAWPRWLLVTGVIVAVVDILSGVFGASHMMEWITVALFLFYVSASSKAAARI
jgi:hypothetical protein